MAPTSSMWGKRMAGPAVTLIVAAGLLAGCGGSSKTASTGTTATGPSAAGASTTVASPTTNTAGPTTVAPATTAPGATAPAATSGSGSDPGSTFCRASAALQKKESSEINAAAGTPAQVQKLEQQSLAELPVFEALAPSSLKSAAALIAEEDRALFKALQAAGFDYSKLGTGVNALLDNPKYTQADTAIDNYETNVCGLGESSPATS